MYIRVYQDEYLASVRLVVDRVEADGNRLKLYSDNSFVGTTYFENSQDCHHIEIS